MTLTEYLSVVAVGAILAAIVIFASIGLLHLVLGLLTFL